MVKEVFALRPPLSIYLGIALIILGLLVDIPFIPFGLRTKTAGHIGHSLPHPLLLPLIPVLILAPLAIIGLGLYLAFRRPKTG